VQSTLAILGKHAEEKFEKSALMQIQQRLPPIASALNHSAMHTSEQNSSNLKQSSKVSRRGRGEI
jgi:hypothetical protein